MKRLIFISTLFLCCNSLAQPPGLTVVPDNSFTTHLAYLAAKKDYPGISIGTNTGSPLIAAQHDLLYCETAAVRLFTDIFFPKKKTASKQTAIIFLFGGGWRSGDRKQQHPLAERLAELGYVCFTPDYRLSPQAAYPAAVHDVKTMIRWVKKNAKQFNVDPAKIAVAGFSAGGELAAFAGATNGMSAFEGGGCHTDLKSDINAVIDIDGILSFDHPDSGEGDDSKKISAATQWLGVGKAANPALWREASALTHVNKTTPPFLFLNSAAERMHAGRTDFITKLDRFQTFSAVKTFQNTPHSFSLFNPWIDSVATEIDNFLLEVFHSNLKAGENVALKSLASAVESLRRAMIDPSVEVLQGLTVDSLIYAHSSGAIDDKKQFIEKLVSGKSDFVSIVNTGQTLRVRGNSAIVQHQLNAETNDGNKPGTVHLAVTQLWIREKQNWKLAGRRAVKII